jgi:glyoxylase-like metal-dependent hydrolase (beta-lactamase superfamily II)
MPNTSRCATGSNAIPSFVLPELPRHGRLVFLPGPNRSPYPNCNGLYVDGTIKVLIDQGGSVEQAKAVKSGRGVDRIYLTHWHEDHALSACQLPDVPVFVSEKDREPVESRKITHERGGIFDQVAARQIDAIYDGMGFHHRPVTGTFKPEAELDLGGIPMVALHTPGHTSGHTCYWFPDEGLVVMGDYDLTRAGPVCPDVDSDVRETYSSLDRLSKLPVKVAACAHGRGWFERDEYRERLVTYTKTLDERLDIVRELVRSGDDTIVKLSGHFRKLFNMPVLPGYEAWAAVSGQMLIRPCTKYLVEEGRLREPEPDRFEVA